MNNRSDDPSHHERMLLPHSYISLPRNSAMGPPWRIDLMTHHTMSECSYHRATSRSQEIVQWSTMRDRSDDPSHHERMLLPQSYISLPRNSSMVHHEGSIQWPIAPWANALTTELHLAPKKLFNGPPWRIDPMTHRTMSECSYHRATSRSQEIVQWSTMRDRSNDPSHHEQTLLPQSYILLPRNSSMGPPWGIDPMTHRTMSKCSYHGATSRSQEIFQWVHHEGSISRWHRITYPFSLRSLCSLLTSWARWTWGPYFSWFTISTRRTLYNKINIFTKFQNWVQKVFYHWNKIKNKHFIKFKTEPKGRFNTETK